MVALRSVQLELPLETPGTDPFVIERTALWYLEEAREMGNLGLISYWKTVLADIERSSE